MQELGASLARALPPLGAGPAVLFLIGELGAGKTTLARGFLAARGHLGAVRSPTFTLAERYALADLTIVHVDLYRLRAPQELEALGLRDDAVPGHVWLIEWAERGDGFLPAPDVRLTLRVMEAGHLADATSCTAFGERWLASLAPP
jgi:tRNA threonylcarbamoyladenosine biosynthesis protein TsaE